MMFNRNPVVLGNKVDIPEQDAIKNTLGLWQSSLEDAVKYGGTVTRHALNAMNIRGDYKHVIVDVKVHMLMPNMLPAIPGWHTDGVPRGKELNPAGKGSPDIYAQENMRSPRFHLLAFGGDCQTKFLKEENIYLVRVKKEPDTKLYSKISQEVQDSIDSGKLTEYDLTQGQIVEWDWWTLHTAQRAKAHGWRYLIRVTETDYVAPQTDLNQIIRTQHQVYVPNEIFGW